MPIPLSILGLHIAYQLHACILPFHNNLEAIGPNKLKLEIYMIDANRLKYYPWRTWLTPLYKERREFYLAILPS